MSEFQDARRELGGLTARLETRVLLWLAARPPGWVGPDHLTFLSLFAMLAAGAAYALSRRDLAWLHVVNLCLAINWFGDSLDGTLARFRNRLRPRYGFYVDHIVGAFGGTELRLLLILANLALFLSPRVTILGRDVRLYDAAGSLATVALSGVLLVSVVRATRTLYEMERLP